MKKYFCLIQTLLFFALLFSSCSSTQEKQEKAQKLYVLAVDSYSKQDFVHAMEYTVQALKCKRTFHQAELLKAKIFFFTDKNAEAEKTISNLAKKYPAYTEARIWQIRILLQNKKFDMAKAMLDRELTFNQTDWRIFYLYALLAEKNENFNQRLSMEKQAENILQESSKVFIDLASIWISLGLRERALDYLEKAKALSVNPETIEEAMRHLKNGDDIL